MLYNHVLYDCAVNVTLISFWNTGVKMFFVSGQGSVTTLSQPQTLYAYQFVNYEPGNAGLEKNLNSRLPLGQVALNFCLPLN